MEESIVIPKCPEEPEWLAKDNRTLKTLAGPAIPCLGSQEREMKSKLADPLWRRRLQVCET